MSSLENIVQGLTLLVDKPIGWTSFDVVNKIRSTIRSTFHIKKIKVGHAGTLDPAATGLLIICTGKLTKQIQRAWIGKILRRFLQLTELNLASAQHIVNRRARQTNCLGNRNDRHSDG